MHLHCNSFQVWMSLISQMQFLQRIDKRVAMKMTFSKQLEEKINCPWLSSPVLSLQVGHYGIIYLYYICTQNHTHSHFLYIGIISYDVSFSELYETQHLLPNKLIYVPCDALKCIFAGEDCLCLKTITRMNSRWSHCQGTIGGFLA